MNLTEEDKQIMRYVYREYKSYYCFLNATTDKQITDKQITDKQETDLLLFTDFLRYIHGTSDRAKYKSKDTDIIWQIDQTKHFGPQVMKRWTFKDLRSYAIINYI